MWEDSKKKYLCLARWTGWYYGFSLDGHTGYSVFFAHFFLFFFFLRRSFAFVTQARVQKCDLSSLQPLPESRRRRLQWAEIAPLHSSLGNEWNSISKKKKKCNPTLILLLNVDLLLKDSAYLPSSVSISKWCKFKF